MLREVRSVGVEEPGGSPGRVQIAGADAPFDALLCPSAEPPRPSPPTSPH